MIAKVQKVLIFWIKWYFHSLEFYYGRNFPLRNFEFLIWNWLVLQKSLLYKKVSEYNHKNVSTYKNMTTPNYFICSLQKLYETVGSSHAILDQFLCHYCTFDSILKHILSEHKKNTIFKQNVQATSTKLR